MTDKSTDAELDEILEKEIIGDIHTFGNAKQALLQWRDHALAEQIKTILDARVLQPQYHNAYVGLYKQLTQEYKEDIYKQAAEIEKSAIERQQEGQSE